MIKIGTRSSELALWQANTVAAHLEELGQTTSIIKIDSLGDQVLDKPLYELGVTGVLHQEFRCGINKRANRCSGSFT
jgi:porphobilinogen deaminase